MYLLTAVIALQDQPDAIHELNSQCALEAALFVPWSCHFELCHPLNGNLAQTKQISISNEVHLVNFDFLFIQIRI